MSDLEEEKYKILYDEFMNYSNQMHKKNKRRIIVGLKCLCIIPILFLILMFTVTENRAAFLVIWILSVLLITSFLIYVEYVDYRLQNQLNKISGTEKTIDALTSDKLRKVQRKARRIQYGLDELFSIPDTLEEEDQGESSEQEGEKE